MPPVSHTLVGGVPVFSADIRISYTGALVFGVGLRDETARSAGTAHLVEHLVMSRVGRVSVEHNAVTADESITFFAQGSPALVADFLNRVARAIAGLHDTSEAEAVEQRRIIAAELGEQDERIGRGNLVDRFGNQSVGLLDLGSPAHRSITLASALRFADTWLHSGNAAMVFSGDIPESLDVVLPPAAPTPERDTPRMIRDAAWNRGGPAALTISLVLTSDDVLVRRRAVSTIAEALHSELRTGQQRIYSVQLFSARLTEDVHFVAFTLDPRADSAVPVAAAALGILRGLAENGPTDELLALDRERWINSDDDSGDHWNYLEAHAAAVLRGRNAGGLPAASGEADVTGEQIRRIVAAAVAKVFVTLGDDTTWSGDDVSEMFGLPAAADPEPYLSTLSKGQAFKHRLRDGVETFSGRFFRGMGGCQLVVDHERVTLVDEDSDAFEVRYDEIVLAGYSVEHRVWSLFARDGHGLFVDLDQWGGPRKLHRLLGERLPPEARYDVDVP